MAIRHYHTIICEYGVVSCQGKHSLVGAFSNVQLARFPGGLFRMCIGIRISGDPGDPYDVTLEGPGLDAPRVLGADELPSVVWPESKYHQRTYDLLIEAGTVVFRRPGVHQVVLRSDGKVIDRHRFGVYQTDGQGGQTSATSAGDGG